MTVCRPALSLRPLAPGSHPSGHPPGPPLAVPCWAARRVRRRGEVWAGLLGAPRPRTAATEEACCPSRPRVRFGWPGGCPAGWLRLVARAAGRRSSVAGAWSGWRGGRFGGGGRSGAWCAGGRGVGGGAGGRARGGGWAWRGVGGRRSAVGRLAGARSWSCAAGAVRGRCVRGCPGSGRDFRSSRAGNRPREDARPEEGWLRPELRL